MSRKKHLSPTASLASCLDFAARVLSSTASVQDVCTKSVLAPMVVEAHRFGHQLVKLVHPSAPADVRKLLSILQDGSTKLKGESPLAGLAVADLTWDFEGTVAHTLEMELEELQDRAATASAETCVVLTSFSPLSGGGHTVVWFPNENNQRGHDEGEARNVQRRYQILLYVCPGRVKVVKNVRDLIKKLYDEIPSLQESDATYKVWAVMMDSSRTKQAALSVRKSQPKSNQDEEERSPFNPVAKTSGSAGNEDQSTFSCTKASKFVVNNSNQEAVEKSPVGSNGSSDRVSELLDRTQDQGNSPPVSPRFSGARDSTQYPSSSIFSFGLPSMAIPRRASDLEKLGLDAVESNVASVCSEGSDLDEQRSSEDEAESPVGDQRVDLHSKRGIVSASLVIPSEVKKTGLGLGPPQQDDFAWRSCDGKVLRTVMRLQRATSPDDEEKMAFTLADGGAQEGNAERHDEDEGLDDIEHEHDDIAGADGCQEVGNDLYVSDILHPSEAQIVQPPSRQPSLRQVFDDVTRSTDDTEVSTIFMFSHTPTSPFTDTRTGVAVGSSSSELLPVIEACGDFGLADVCQVAGDKTSPLNSSEQQSEGKGDSKVCRETISELLNLPAIDDKDDRVPKPKPAPVNYKDKLGARVWFELECTARRLESEERLERRQQIRRRQRRDFAKRWQISAQGNSDGPRRKEPTGWAKSNRPMKQKETLSEGISNTQQLSNAVAVTPVPEPTQANRLIEDAAVSQLMKSEAKPMEMSTGQPYSQECPDERGELILSKEISITESPKTLDSCVEMSSHAEGNSKHVENAQPSIEQRLTCDENQDSASFSVQQDGQIAHGVAGELSHESVGSPAFRGSIHKSREHISSASYERRRWQGGPISHSMVRGESLTYSTKEPSILPNINHTQGNTECFPQRMWGSTHSHEFDDTAGAQRTSKEDELHQTEITSTIPFIIRGRVPIRTRSSSSRERVPDESSCSGGTERSPVSSKANHDTTAASSHFRKSPTNKTSRIQAPRKLQAVSAAPPVATFIALSDDRISTSDTAASAREERLNDLRLKKLHKLKQTRDLSLRQKYRQRQEHRPLSFANSVYSKKASNRQLIQNALEFTLLAGGSMEKERTLALQALAESSCDNFIVLLKSQKELKFRALYESHVEGDCAIRIFSVLSSNSSRAPAKIGNSEMISQFFKYSSAKKEFMPVPTRSFTVKTDACALVDQLVFKGKSKPGTSALARLLY